MPADTSALPLLRSFRVQTALLFGSMAILLCCTLAITLGSLLSDEAQRDKGRSLDMLAQVAARTLADGMSHRLHEVQSLAGAADLWEAGLASPAAARAMARSQALTPHSAWIGVAGPDGMVRSATQDLLVGKSVATRPWFVQGLRGSHVGDVHPAKLLASLLPASASGEPLRFVDFAAPIHVDGRLIGVIGVHGTWDWAREVLESLLPDDAAQRSLSFFIFDKNGVVLDGPAGAVPSATLPASALPATALREGPAASGAATWSDGQEYLTSMARVVSTGAGASADLGWTVVVREPVALAFAEAHASGSRALAIGLVAALFAGAIAWLASGFLSRPLAAVSQAAQAVEQGVPGARIPLLDHNQELRGLSHALAAMTARLLGTQEALEERVRQRTDELHRANAELARAHIDLHELARRDALTGLHNRRAFEERFGHALALARRTGAPLSVLAVDADHFKRVNDRFGHDIGDKVLQTIAATLAARIRDSDLAARIGGEEFAVLLPATDAAGALQLAEALIALMAATEIAPVGHITISIGVATQGGVGETRDEFLKRADQALYQAKAAGRNRACVAGVELPAIAEPFRPLADQTA
ncbi:diguanylate cyclase [soil metagenome]